MPEHHGLNGAAPHEIARLEALRNLDILDTAPEPQFDRIVRLASHILAMPISAVTLVDEVRQWFKARVGLAPAETPRSQSFCSHAIMDEAVMVVEDATSDSRFAENPLVTGDPNIRFYAGAPLTLKSGDRVGALCVIDRQPRAFSSDQRGLLQDLAAIVVDEMELRLMNQRLSELAATDPLTALMNRRAFFAAAEREIARIDRYGGDLVLMMLDIDRFKQINDRFGHEVGDTAIIKLANLLESALRPEVLLCRMGGDEFSLALPETPIEAVRPITQRLLDQVRALRIETGDSEVACTISLGATIRLPGEKLAASLHRADEALYEAKRAGRDRATVRDPRS